MGCCSSTARPSTPTPTSQAVNPPQSSHSSAHPITSAPQALSQVFNAPLKPHYWAPKSRERQWTASSLAAERQVFWDTAVTNRAEIWASLHLACDELVGIPASVAKTWGDDNHAEIGRADMESRVRNAQAIIDAAGITLPTGDLVDGAYDAFGAHYALPVWVLCNPENLAPEGTVSKEQRGGVVAVEDAVGPVPLDGGTDDDDIAMLKGKGKELAKVLEVEAKKVETITVKCRLTDGRQDVVVKIPKDAKVTVLSKKVAKVAEAKIRLAYLGKMLDPSKTLIDQGWQEGNVVSALVFPTDR